MVCAVKNPNRITTASRIVEEKSPSFAGEYHLFKANKQGRQMSALRVHSSGEIPTSRARVCQCEDASGAGRREYPRRRARCQNDEDGKARSAD